MPPFPMCAAHACADEHADGAAAGVQTPRRGEQVPLRHLPYPRPAAVGARRATPSARTPRGRVRTRARHAARQRAQRSRRPPNQCWGDRGARGGSRSEHLRLQLARVGPAGAAQHPGWRFVGVIPSSSSCSHLEAQDCPRLPRGLAAAAAAFLDSPVHPALFAPSAAHACMLRGCPAVP